MLEFFRTLFGTDFMPHLYCLRSDPGVLWLEVVSDVLIAAAYFAIPLLLFDVILKRKDLLFRRVALLFVVFIAACGSTHVLAAWTIWVPVYRLEAVLKAVTALASVTTAVVLLRIRPHIFSLPSLAQLQMEIRLRELAEREARDKDVRFRAFVDSVTDYAIYMLDPEGIVLSWNSGAQRLKGYTAEEIVGKSFATFFTAEEREIGVPQEILRIAREKGGFEGEGWRVRKDGSRFLANVHLRPLVEGGVLRGFSKVTRDLTETREMEEKYRMLLEAAPDAIVIVDKNERVNYINAQAEKMFGYRRSEVVGQTVEMLVPPRAQAAQAEYMRRLADGSAHPAEGIPPEIWGLRKNGEEFPLEFSVSPLDTQEGPVLLFAIRDLTEKRRTERRFQAVLEAAPDPLFIFNRDDTITYMNRRAEEVFGCNRRDVVGKTANVLIPERLRQDRARERQDFFERPEKLTSGYDGEYLCLRGDGTEFPVEASRSPLETADGMMILTTVRDVTERKEREARFRALLEAVPDTIMIIDQHHVIQFLSDRGEELFGYARAELLGLPISIVDPERFREERSKLREQLFHDLKRVEFGGDGRFPILRKDGSELPVEITISPFETRDGWVLLSAVRDISERLKAETRFRELLEAGPDAILIVDGDGRIEYANLQAELLLGYSRPEFLSKSIAMLAPERTREERAIARQRMFAERKRMVVGADGSYPVIRKDGSEFPAEFNLNPFETPAGWVFLLSIRDISERIRSEARFRAVLEAVPEGIVMIDPEGTIRYVNRQTEAMYGRGSEELLGQDSSILVPERMREERRAHRARLIAGEALHSGGETGNESIGMRKDWSEFPTEISFSPLETAEGRMFLYTIRDVTERVKSEQRFRALLEAVPDAILITDANDRIQYVNPQTERLFGYGRGELLGQLSEILSVDRLRAERVAYRKQLIAGGPAYLSPTMTPESFGRRKDGSEFPSESTFSPLETAQGQLYLFAVRDITERRKSEARFQALLEGAPDAIVITDAEGRIRLVNKLAERLYGYDRSELLGQLGDILAPERLREPLVAFRQRLLTGALPVPSLDSHPEILGLRKDGTEFPLEFSFSPLDTDEGEVFLFAIRDITERKKSEARFRALLDSAPDAMVITNREGTIELINRQAERLYGYAREEMVGQRVEMLIPVDLRAGYRKDAQAFLSGDFEREMGAEVELRALRKDGSELPVEIRFSPLEGPTGTLMTAAVRDITERRKSERRFRALLESAPDAMVIVNPDGQVVLANLQTEKLFGYERSELVGQCVDILVPPQSQAEHVENRRQYFIAPRQREMGVGRELMAVRKDGSQFPVEISLSPLEGVEGTSVTAAIRDITERKQAAQQLAEKMAELRQSNEALEQFAHIASHDLQEPLRMVASYVQLLEKRYKGKLDSDADEFIHFAVDGTQRMKRLIEDLLLYSRAGRGAPAARELQVEDVLRLAMGNLKAAIDESEAQVTWDPLPRVKAAETQLVQIFQNLIGNAIKYRGAAAPRIHVSARKSESEREAEAEWIFSVGDNGIGIEKKYYERVFVIFQRLHGRGEYEGTGIGLAICKRILQQQGGRIWVESEPGQGSTFHFTLPARSTNDV